MRCNRVQRLLSEHREKKIPSVEEHLKICPDCAREMDELGATEEQLKSGLMFSAERLSPFFETHLVTRLREERARKPTWPRVPVIHWKPGWALAAVPLIVLIIFLLLPTKAVPPEEDLILSSLYGEETDETQGEKDPELFYRGALAYVMEKGEPLGMWDAVGEDWTSDLESLTPDEGQRLIDSLKTKWIGGKT